MEKLEHGEKPEEGEYCLIEKTSAPVRLNCPRSLTPSKRVNTRTVMFMLTPAARKRLTGQQYYFCNDPACEIVYFDATGVAFTTSDVAVKVFAKDAADDVPVCYCYNWTREALRKEVEETGRSTAAKEISVMVKNGECACDIKNPRGECCLGDVNTTVNKTIVTSAAKTLDGK